MGDDNRAVQLRTSSALAEQIRKIKPHLDRLLPDPARFGTSMIAAARHNPELLECDPASVIGAALQCAQLGLEPGPAGHVFLVPFRNNKTGTKDVEIIPGWKGLKVLAERHPNILLVDTGVIHENDHWVHTAVPAHLEHTPAQGERGDPVRWYAIAHTVEGPDIIEVLDRADVEKRRHAGNSANSPAWTKWWDRMARKSAVRAIWPRLPSSLDMERANQIGDGAVVTPDQLGANVDAERREPPVDGQVDVELVDENGEPMIRGTAPATPPDTEEAGAPSQQDRTALQVLTLQKQRGLDDHDLVELIRDRHDVEADTVEAAVGALTEAQADALVAELQGDGS